MIYSNTHLKDLYLCMSEFTDADTNIQLHPPNLHLDGPFLYCTSQG